MLFTQLELGAQVELGCEVTYTAVGENGFKNPVKWSKTQDEEMYNKPRQSFEIGNGAVLSTDFAAEGRFILDYRPDTVEGTKHAFPLKITGRSPTKPL